MQFSNIPKIPGMGFGEELLRTDYRKRQLLGPNGVLVDNRDKVAVQIFDTMRLSNTQLGGNTTSKLSLDRKVLHFQAFFKEGVHESPLEQERLRKCGIFYFLEDDTISVSEPKQDNSGISGQGALIKRHQIPKPDGTPHTFEDFNVGQEVTFYGKTFHLIDCDAFTRKFLIGIGLNVPDPEAFPDDQYTEIRKKVTAQMVPRKPKAGEDMDYQQPNAGRRTKLTPDEISGTQKFLANDKKVLRFSCQWNDCDNLYGDVRLFTLFYFLADDTIEITETNAPNCGRDPFPSFVKRSQIPKPCAGRFVNPNASLSFKPQCIDYYTEMDLRIGAVLQVFGRQLMIYDCDQFTRKYMEQFGIYQPTPIDISQPGPMTVPLEPPPYNGFGNEEDSLGSWKYLVLKAPKKDTKKLTENADNQLRFQLRLVGAGPSNEIRRFVLTFFLADDTLTIFEPAQRNSGIVGGKFLQRQAVKKAGQDGLPSGGYLTPQDFFIGATVIINTHQFLVCSTDERSLNFMEDHPNEYPKSNVDSVLANLRSMLVSQKTGLQQAFLQADTSGDGSLNYQEFAAIVEQLRLPVVEQEILTLMRHFDRNGDGCISWQEFMQLLLPAATQAQYDDVRDQEWEQIRQIAELQKEDELDRFRSDMHSTVQQLNSLTDQAMHLFLEKWNQRRVLFTETFKTVADNSGDGNIGEAEFRRAVQLRLKLGLSERHLKALCFKFFPEQLRRIPLSEFLRILNGTSSHLHVSIPRS